MWRRAVPLLLFVIPTLLVGALWLASGREKLTKSQKVIEVRTRDELFGDVSIERQFTRGPIGGYFIGLDSLLVTGIASATLAGLWLYLIRRRKMSGLTERANDDS